MIFTKRSVRVCFIDTKIKITQRIVKASICGVWTSHVQFIFMEKIKDNLIQNFNLHKIITSTL